MLTVIGVVVVGAIATTIASAMGRCPLWIPVFLLCVAELLRILPIGK